MASGRQTPAPKVSSGKESEKQEKPAVEHLEAGKSKGIAKGQEEGKTSKQSREDGDSKINEHKREY